MNSDEKLEAEMEKITASGKGMGSLLTSGGFRAHVKEKTAAFDKADGEDMKGDARVVGMDEALAALREQIALARANAIEAGAEDSDKWLLAASQVEFYGKTLDDLLMAYLRWSLKEEDRSGVGADVTGCSFNINKVLRRVEALANWGWENRKVVMEPPLNMAVLEEFYPKMGTVISNFTPEGSPIWAFRFKKMDTMDLEKGNLEEWNPVIRNQWYLMHKLAFEPSTQNPGLVMVMDIGKIGIMESMKMFPPKVKNKLDNLVQGCAAIKTNRFCMINPSFWGSAMMKIFSFFMTKKMKSRMRMCGDDYTKLFDAVGGSDRLPSFMGNGATGSNADRCFKGTVFHSTPSGEDGVGGGLVVDAAAQAEAEAAIAEAMGEEAAAGAAAAVPKAPARVVAL